MNETLKAWITVVFYLCLAVLIIVIALKSYKYIRGFLKRSSLLRRIKKICKTRGYRISYSKNALFSALRTSARNEMRIVAGDKEYNIKFAAALKRKDTYTFTDTGSYYTSNNFNPIFLSHGHPASGLAMNKDDSRRLRIPIIFRAKDNFVKEVHTGAPDEGVPVDNAVNILCVNPVPIKLEIVRTNRPEQAFDGDEFMGYVIYSGQGLCKLLSDV